MSYRLQNDFREEAETASLALLGDSRPTAPFADGLSLCVRPAEDRSAFHVRASFRYIGYLMCTVALTFSWLSLFFISNPPRFILAFVLPVLGLCGMFFTSRIHQNHLRRFYRKCQSCLFDPNTPNSFAVIIEDAQTFKKNKIIPEDFGIFWADTQSNTIYIEGNDFQYVIRASDIKKMVRHVKHAENGVVLYYQIGDVELGLSICYLGHGFFASMANAFSSTYGTNIMTKIIGPMIKHEKYKDIPLTETGQPIHPPTRP